MLRIVIDLDGPICEIKKENQSYDELEPIIGAKEKIKELRANGHYIIILSARNMATCNSNLGKVMKNVGKITLEWLEKNEIEYDEIYFGKPNGDIYIDDRAVRFTGWEKIDGDYIVQNAKKR